MLTPWLCTTETSEPAKSDTRSKLERCNLGDQGWQCRNCGLPQWAALPLAAGAGDQQQAGEAADARHGGHLRAGVFSSQLA